MIIPYFQMYRICFYNRLPIRLLERLIFELDAFSYSSKIVCILFRQSMSLKKRVASSAKLTVSVSWFPIWTPFTLVLEIMKLASTSAAMMYNNIESGHPWQTPRIRVKESDRRAFILFQIGCCYNRLLSYV